MVLWGLVDYRWEDWEMLVVLLLPDGSEAYRFSINWNNFMTGKSLDTVKVDIEQLSMSEFTSEYTNRGLENKNVREPF